MSLCQDPAPAQNICCCSSSDALGEGKEAAGKLRQRTTSKEKFIAQQKNLYPHCLRPRVGNEGVPVQHKRHRVSAKQGWCSCGRDPKGISKPVVLGVDFRSKFSIWGQSRGIPPLLFFLSSQHRCPHHSSGLRRTMNSMVVSPCSSLPPSPASLLHHRARHALAGIAMGRVCEPPLRPALFLVRVQKANNGD